ncbi:hypothetical protein KGQ19_20220, partial [Catenulispora sp. NL8]
MFEHVGRKADIDDPIPHRQRRRIATHIPDRPQIHRQVPSTRRLKSRREEPRPTAHIPVSYTNL